MLRLAVIVSVLLAAPAAAYAGFAAEQPANFSKTFERRGEFDAPAYRALQARVGASEAASLSAALAADPERDTSGNLCASHEEGCQGDARLYGWQEAGHGVSTAVLYTAADGATISGHVWATKAGPARRPGVVIAGGSAQAPEQAYWWAATTLAKDGYVVLTFDVQGQGRADTYGEGEDRTTHVPAEPEEASRTTSSWLDGLRGALEFMQSTPDAPYEPSPSPVTGASHRAKQDRRAKAGLDAAYNPLWPMLDRTAKLGLAGHSTGAQTTEQLSRDPRVGAVVVWDDVDTSDDSAQVRPNDVPPAPRVPALTFGADYGIPAAPYDSPPDPGGRTTVSRAYSAAGLDTMAVNVRGGTHLEWSWIANDALSASLRGIDEAAWYTQAWFDRYLKHDAGAGARLLTDRWTQDAAEAAVDPGHDGNLFSTYYRSRIDAGRDGGRRVTCEDLGRKPCSAVAPDGLSPASYSWLAQAMTPDSAGPAVVAPAICARTARIRLRPGVRQVVVRIEGRRARVLEHLRAVAVRLPGSGGLTVRLRETLRSGARRRVTVRFRGCRRVAGSRAVA